MIDDQYTSNGGAKFPIKWSPPEVLNYTRFSSKSDVWAFGVLCWEVFTCGDMPYGRSKNPEVVERVQRGQVLSRPQGCPHQVYEVIEVYYVSNMYRVRKMKMYLFYNIANFYCQFFIVANFKACKINLVLSLEAMFVK